MRCDARGLILLATLAAPAAAQTSPPTYHVLVASPLANQVAFVRFNPPFLVVEHRTNFVEASDAPSGPAVLRVAPDRRDYYVGTVAGFAGSELLRMAIAGDSMQRDRQPPDTIRAREALGANPRAIDVTRDGAYAWVTSSPADRGADTGWVSTIYVGQLAEITRVRTCRDVAGSRLDSGAVHHYSLCRGDDVLVVVRGNDVRTLPLSASTGRCDPGGLTLSPDTRTAWVACRRSRELLSVDLTEWRVVQRDPLQGDGDDVVASADGRTLVVIHRRAESIELIELPGRNHRMVRTQLSMSMLDELTQTRNGELMLPVMLAKPGLREPTSATVSDDGRYLFVAVTHGSTANGSVEAIDLKTGSIVASVDVGRAPSAIESWSPAPR